MDYARETDRPSDRSLLQYALCIQTAEQHRTGNMKLVLDNNEISQKQLSKQVQNVCIVYACLAVKRNAGIVSTDAKYAAAARGYDRSLFHFFLDGRGTTTSCSDCG